METRQINATVKWGKCGQDHPYGDTHRRCEIHTNEELTDKDILDLVGEHSKLPESEFDKGGLSMAQYFVGYYTIEKTDYGYFYHGVEPYDD
jgi:hypothetical protein